MQTPPAGRRETSRLPTVCLPARVLSTNNPKCSKAYRCALVCTSVGLIGTGRSGERGFLVTGGSGD